MARHAWTLIPLLCMALGAAAWAEDARPLYYDHALTPAELDGRTLRELTLMRNTIYARAGHQFRKAWLRDYFTAQPWYKPLAKDDESKITATDKANAKAIADVEGNQKKEVLQQRQKDIVARQAAGKASPEDEIELHLISSRLGEWVAEDKGFAPADERSPLEDPRLLDKLLTVKQLSNLSRRDLRILRNTFYARHGRPFKSEILQEYFGNMDWYKIDEGYTDKQLTKIDRANIRMVKSVEDSLGGPLTEHDNKQEDGWFSQS